MAHGWTRIGTDFGVHWGGGSTAGLIVAHGWTRIGTDFWVHWGDGSTAGLIMAHGWTRIGTDFLGALGGWINGGFDCGSRMDTDRHGFFGCIGAMDQRRV
jgi:hypothetical protein